MRGRIQVELLVEGLRKDSTFFSTSHTVHYFGISNLLADICKLTERCYEVVHLVEESRGRAG